MRRYFLFLLIAIVFGTVYAQFFGRLVRPNQFENQLVNLRLDFYVHNHNSAILDQAIVEALGSDFLKLWFNKDVKNRLFVQFSVRVNPYGEVTHFNYGGSQYKSIFTPSRIDSIKLYIRKNNIKFSPSFYNGEEDMSYEECQRYLIKEFSLGGELERSMVVGFPDSPFYNYRKRDTVGDIDNKIRDFYDFIHRYSAPTSREILASNGIKVFSTRSFIITDSPNVIYYDPELLDKYDEYVFSSYLSSNKGDSLRLAQNNVTLAAKYLKRFKRDDFFRQMCFRRALELDPGNKAASKYFKK